ncbi:MAG: O-antigen ligase family protein [Eubacteriales bacterium]|nr:O-antigen ligase family protein [Eubacteriales bacterium]
MNISSKVIIPKTIHVHLCDIALLIYFCVMFAHQQETLFGRCLRYGSLFFVLGSTLVTYPIPLDRKNRIEWHVDSFGLWMLAVLCYGAVSMIWCMDMGSAVNVLWNLVKVLAVCFCLAPRLNSEKEIERICSLLLLALVYMVILLLVLTPRDALGTIRIGSELGQNSNEIGRLAGLGSLLSFYFYTRKQHKMYLLLVAVFAGTALLTGSKNAILILLFQLGLYIFLIAGSWKKLLAVAAAAAGAVALYWLVMHNAVLYGLVGSRIERMLGFLGGGDVDGSTMERLYFMRTAAQLFLQHPLKGIGLDSFSAYLASIGYHNAVYSHCGFLELLSTLGVVGFVLYYGMYAKILSGLRKPALARKMLLAVCFTLALRMFLFDISTISLYTYHSYILLLLAYACMHVQQRPQEMRMSGKRGER